MAHPSNGIVQVISSSAIQRRGRLSYASCSQLQELHRHELMMDAALDKAAVSTVIACRMDGMSV